jgi:hypothetical protein
MVRKLGAVAACALMLIASGCGRKLTCENLAKKNTKCAESFEAYAKARVKKTAEKMKRTGSAGDEEQLEKELSAHLERAGKLMREAMSGKPFIEQCQHHWRSSDPEDQKKKKKLIACFEKKDCEAYVSCVMDTILLAGKLPAPLQKKAGKAGETGGQ